jgi:hypothetical protein
MIHNASLSPLSVMPICGTGLDIKIKRLFVLLIVSSSLSLVKRDPRQEPEGSVVNPQTWYDTDSGA